MLGAASQPHASLGVVIFRDCHCLRVGLPRKTLRATTRGSLEPHVM